MKIRQMLFGMATGLPMMAMAATPHGIEVKNLDLKANPKEDFYQYACGGWMESNPLTGEYSRFGMFDLLRENAREQLKELIENLSDNPDSKIAGTNAQKVADIYKMGMDSVKREELGATPIMPYIERIKNWDKNDLAGLLADTHMVGTSIFFGTGVGADAKNSDWNIMHIGESGLGLGDRDYYLEDTPDNKKIMEAYEKYVKRIMELVGYSPEEQQRVWENVIAIETEVAKNVKTREERRNPQLRYNLFTLDELRTKFNNIDWDTYFSGLGIEGLDKVNVTSLKFLGFMNEYLPTLEWQKIEDYLVFDLISSGSGLLSEDFYDADFEMYGKVMSGKEEKTPLWKRAMGIPNSMFGEAVGELYVAKYFPPENKDYMLKLVENLRGALGEHIDSLIWMSDETKKKAHEKLEGFTVKIGYPDKWKDYSDITIDPEKDYYENVHAASVWYNKDNYSKLNKPVDKEEWLMTPQTVNAYYMPTTNEICFPAAILQPPYFDLSADDAINYGAIGVVIGHEMTHGFDDQGRQYNVKGNLEDWWQPEDAEKFKALADMLVQQFDAVEVAPGVHANGTFTLGENIADQGGLRIAMTAYQNATKGQEPKEIDGYTPLQRFYLAYANVWANNIREEEILKLTKIDPHSLGKNRVNVTLKNLAPFQEAFSIEEGDKMYLEPEKRVVIW